MNSDVSFSEDKIVVSIRWNNGEDSCLEKFTFKLNDEKNLKLFVSDIVLAELDGNSSKYSKKPLSLSRKNAFKAFFKNKV